MATTSMPMFEVVAVGLRDMLTPHLFELAAEGEEDPDPRLPSTAPRPGRTGAASGWGREGCDLRPAALRATAGPHGRPEPVDTNLAFAFSDAATGATGPDGSPDANYVAQPARCPRRVEPGADGPRSCGLSSSAVMRRLRAEFRGRPSETHRSLGALPARGDPRDPRGDAGDATGERAATCVPLGDLLLQVYIHAAVAEERGRVHHRRRRPGTSPHKHCRTLQTSATRRRTGRGRPPSSTTPGRRSRPRSGATR